MAMSESPWGVLSACAATLGVALGIFAGVGTLSLGPIQADLVSLHHDVEHINTTMSPLLTLYAQHKADEDRFVSFQAAIDAKMDKNVYDVFSTMVTERIADLAKTNNAALGEAVHQIHDLEGSIVSRSENQVHWNATDALTLRVNALADRKCDVAPHVDVGKP